MTCVEWRSCAWVHFQGRGKWRKRHGSRGKALNKRTGIKFYPSPHRLKNPIVGSLGTSARSYLRSLPRQQENTSQPKTLQANQASPPGIQDPSDPQRQRLVQRTPDQHCVTPTSLPIKLHHPRAAGLQGGARAHAHTFRRLAARGLLGGRTSQSPGQRGAFELHPRSSLSFVQSREIETSGFRYRSRVPMKTKNFPDRSKMVKST